MQLSAAETGWSPQALAADPQRAGALPVLPCARTCRWSGKDGHTETCRCMLTGLDLHAPLLCSPPCEGDKMTCPDGRGLQALASYPCGRFCACVLDQQRPCCLCRLLSCLCWCLQPMCRASSGTWWTAPVWPPRGHPPSSVCHALRNRTEHALCLTACQMHVEGCRWRTLIGLLLCMYDFTIFSCSSLFGEGLA